MNKNKNIFQWNEEINSMINKEQNVVIDGAINLEKYLNSKHKILWLLKEPYSTEDQSFAYKEMFTSKELYEDFFKNVAVSTWHPIIYISYSILHNYLYWEELSYIRENPKMCDVVNEISIINANKNFSLTGTYTIDSNLENGFEKFKSINLQQIENLNPEILIFGNTFYLYKKYLEITESNLTFKTDDNTLKIYEKNGKIYFDANHPAKRISREKYINPIIKYLKNKKT
jgi:hypothetical protein